MDATVSLMCPEVKSKYGAPMGRRSQGRDNPALRGPFYIRKIKLAQGYDPGGAYWGDRPDGLSLYGYLSHDGLAFGFMDAADRKGAVAELRKIHPNAKLA